MPDVEDGAAGCGAGGADGVLLLEAAVPLLPVAGDDEQRVVDADGQADHRDDVGDEEGELEPLPENGGDAEGDDDGEDAEHQWHEGGHHGAEDEQQHDEGDGHADRLSGLQVLLGDLLELVLDAGAAADQHRVGGVGVRLLDDVENGADIVLGLLIVAGHHEGEDGGALIGGDEGDVSGLVEVGAAGDDAGSKGCDAVVDILDERLETRVRHSRIG